MEVFKLRHPRDVTVGCVIATGRTSSRTTWKWNDRCNEDGAFAAFVHCARLTGVNAVVAIPSIAPVSTWPTHNFFPTSATAVEFMNYNGGSGGNYQLLSSSPYKGAGTDGKDLGADVPGVNAAIARLR
jgi:hypothetical protein